MWQDDFQMNDILFRNGSTVAGQVAEHLRGLIRAGALQRGDALPTYRAVARERGVAYLTVKSAFDQLVAEGLVARHRRRGCSVAHDPARQSRTLRKVGLVFSPFGNAPTLFDVDYAAALVLGIMAECHRLDCGMQMFSLSRTGPFSAGDLLEDGVDGAIYFGIENVEYLQQAARWNLPGVAVDYYSPAVSMDCIACDNDAAARRLTEYLLGLGHRRIGYIGGAALMPTAPAVRAGRRVIDSRSSDAIERREAVLGILREAGALAEDAVSPAGPDESPDLARVVAAWRASRHPATAVITYSDRMAQALIRRFDAEGIGVPRDVSVAAVAGSLLSTSSRHRVTACRFDFRRMGIEAVQVLRARCLRPRRPRSQVHRIPCEFVDGQTSAPPSV
jgi:DNA-binding LacI/PurR family transcriptional regulator